MVADEGDDGLRETMTEIGVALRESSVGPQGIHFLLSPCIILCEIFYMMYFLVYLGSLDSQVSHSRR